MPCPLWTPTFFTFCSGVRLAAMSIPDTLSVQRTPRSDKDGPTAIARALRKLTLSVAKIPRLEFSSKGLLRIYLIRNREADQCRGTVSI